MSDSVGGIITFLAFMAYCIPIAFITLAAPLVGTILAVVSVCIIFWLMAIKGKAAQ